MIAGAAGCGLTLGGGTTVLSEATEAAELISCVSSVVGVMGGSAAASASEAIGCVSAIARKATVRREFGEVAIRLPEAEGNPS